MPDPLNWLTQLLGGGDPEAQGAAQASTAMQPQVLDYAQRVLSGQIAREGVLGQPRPYDPALSYRENVPDTRASLEPAIDVAMGIGPGAIRAFHGSPFNFSRFDMSKIGAGEGAQAYGHGLYFAEAEDVARAYRDTLAPPAVDTGYHNIDVELAKVHGGDWAAFKAAYPNPPPALKAAIADIEARGATGATPSGHMYEVDINADPQRLLDWDKPLSEQPGMAEKLPRTGQYQPVGEALRRAYRNRFFGGDLIGAREASPAEVSQHLQQTGIPGIRYLDWGSRGGIEGERTSNYVVFDDKLIDILRKYGIVPPLAGAGALAAAGSEPPT